MRSIRLSLMLYFLALLALALGTASLLVYRNAERTLADRQQAMGQLIEAQYRERCRDQEARLNDELLAQAQSLARLVQVQFDGSRADVVQSAFLLGAAPAALGANGYLTAPLWLVESIRPPRDEFGPWAYFEVRRHLPPRLGWQLKLDKLLMPDEGLAADYFQIDGPGSKPYRSRSLGDRSFALDTSAFDPDEVVHWVFDDTRLGPDTPVRRVVLKASGVGQVFPPRRGRGPTIYVHCAAELDKLHAALDAFRRQRDDELARVAAQTEQSLRDLRLWLLGIALAVFAATGAGGLALVRLGLAPLRRLSDAVSRVSARDFRLPLGERPLPSELRPIAERLASTLDLLKRAFAREKQAAADISHELRTPLAALLTTTEFALRKPRAAEQYRELLSDCHTSAQQMNQIVERLLTLARLDAGVDRLRVQPVDVAELARQCAAVVRPLAEARGLRLTVKPPAGGACVVHADPDKLREIVTNLLHNAIQYNRPGGAVEVGVARHNGTLDLEVHDTGIGIAAEAREHIFERFYRADPSRGGDDLHAGLGLAIVKEYIDLMRGSIDVDSVEGQGSTFRVRLPAG